MEHLGSYQLNYSNMGLWIYRFGFNCETRFLLLLCHAFISEHVYIFLLCNIYRDLSRSAGRSLTARFQETNLCV